MTERSSRAKKNIVVGRFILTYVLLMGMFVFLIGAKPIKKILDINGVYTNMIIYFTYLVLKPFGVMEGIDGSVIKLKGLALDVRFGCNGLEAFLIYTVAVLSFPSNVKKKSVGIIVGFIVLQILNVLRIAGLGLSGIYAKHYFHYIHVYIAQGMMIAVAFLLFLVWLNYATKK